MARTFQDRIDHFTDGVGSDEAIDYALAELAAEQNSVRFEAETYLGAGLVLVTATDLGCTDLWRCSTPSVNDDKSIRFAKAQLALELLEYGHIKPAV